MCQKRGVVRALQITRIQWRFPTPKRGRLPQISAVVVQPFERVDHVFALPLGEQPEHAREKLSDGASAATMIPWCSQPFRAYPEASSTKC